jgi:hypothetical protein
MEKNARVEVGKTPSQQDGRLATMIKRGEALAEGEQSSHTESDIAKQASVSDFGK